MAKCPFNDAEITETRRVWEQNGRSRKKTAEALGLTISAVQRRLEAARNAAQQGDAPEYDITHPLPDGLKIKGTSIRYDGDGNIDQYWNKSGLQGRDADDAVKLADPKKITKISTNYDAQGRITQQWVSEKPEDKAREALWIVAAKAMASELPRAEPLPAPDFVDGDLLACYPVGDHHLGMLSWGKETGASYDLKIGEQLLVGATDFLMSSVPACEQALIVFLGDFMHYDSTVAVTPSHGNPLDADGRHPMMIRVAIRSMRYMIAAALRRHQKVSVIVEIGNHDLYSAIFLMECMRNIYENEPRVTIDTSPAHFHYFEFGACFVGTHHGHGVKMEKLPLIMATDRPEIWGRTEYRYWWTGHVHHRETMDYQGCSVESFRILAPVDAWAAQKGYRSIRDMKAIILHKKFGEVARISVNPDMVMPA
jgi:hypothetical protein